MRLESRASRRTWLVFAAAVLTVLPAATPAVAAVPATPTALPHAVGGFQPGPVRTPAKSTLGPASASEVLPTSVDLLPYAPPVGDQGQVASCVAWTIGYSIMGYYAKRTEGVGAPYAPLFLYLRNVARGGAPNAGLIPDYVLANAQSAGVTTQADYWQGTTNWQTAPTQAQIDNARNYRVSGWNRLFNGANQGEAAQTSIKRALASGTPVALGIPVFTDFMYLHSHSLYSTVTGTNLGGHMITAYGYDAQGVYIRNSWGSGWGNAGDAHLAWSFITRAATGAYAVNGITTPAEPLPAPPTVGALTTAKATAGTSVTITGTGLSTVTSVKFGGTAATFTAQTVDGSTRLAAVAPAHAAGTVDVTVTNPAGTSAVGTASKFTYVPPAPVITSVVPASGLTYQATPVVVTGTEFAGITSVLAGDKPVAFGRVSATAIKITMPAGTAGARSLRVVTPGGTSAATTASTFTYLAPAAPVITSLVPTAGSAAARTPVVVTGRNLAESTKLTVDGVSVPYTKVSATQVQVLLPVHAAGPVDVQLTTPGGTSAVGTGARFTFIAPPRPAITRLSVSSTAVRAATPLTITGTGFVGATKVTVGDLSVAFTRVSESQLRLTVPARTTGGTVPVTVTAAGGTSEGTPFTFVVPAAKTTAGRR